MRKTSLLFATMLGLGLVGCTPSYTPTQAGGSGDEVAYPPLYAQYDRWGCRWDDTNCREIYEQAGGD